MKKILLIILIMPVFILTTGCTSKVMTRIMSSWEGCDINDVIDQWGYPSYEKTISGRKLYYWEYTKSAYIPQSSSGTVNSYGNTAFYQGSSYGGHMLSGICTRILEVNENNKVVRWQWQGNNCPFAEWFEYKKWRNRKVFFDFQDEEFNREVLKAYSLINQENLTGEEKEKLSLIFQNKE